MDLDCFVEYMVKQKKTPANIFKSIGIVFGAILLSMIVSLLLLMFIPAAMSILPALIALVVFFAYKLISALDIEFEYTLTNGELDVDKIMHKRRRKRLITVHAKAFTAFARVGDPELKHEENAQFGKVIDASSKSPTYDEYYVVFFKNGQKFKLIFNPTQKMIDIFKLYAPRVVK